MDEKHNKDEVIDEDTTVSDGIVAMKMGLPLCGVALHDRDVGVFSKYYTMLNGFVEAELYGIKSDSFLEMVDVVINDINSKGNGNEYEYMKELHTKMSTDIEELIEILETELS